jgi:diaminopimelate epimerase
MTVPFFKYQGTGNDFVIIDNRNGAYTSLTKQQISHICNRRFGVGADGLMLLENTEGYDFKMVYFNADGSESTMCGNGGRCLVKFAYHIGLHKNSFNFLAVDGAHQAEITTDGLVRLKMVDVNNVEEHDAYSILNTGSPHYIKFDEDVEAVDVLKEGSVIRNSERFKTEGINVNFTEQLKNDAIFVRTYERGVENETYSCGTGVTAAALVFAHNDNGFNQVRVKTLGGMLSVEFYKINSYTFNNIWLCGPALLVYSGTITI